MPTPGLPRLLGSVIVAFSVFAEFTSAAEKPNVVVILCDDLGYGDVRCLNPEGKIATPHLDRIASAGMHFTDAHSGSAVCSPTRYGLLTGRYAWRSRLKSGVLGGLSPRLIEPDRMTVASFAKAHGYHTACVGKWHLGMNWVVRPGKSISELSIEPREQVHNVDYSQPTTNGPNSVGFDWYYGISASLDMVPYTFIENDRCTILPSVEKSFPMMWGETGQMTRLGPAAPDFEATDVLPTLTRKAVEYIDRRVQADRNQPFFLYVPLASPHTPIAPTPEWRKKSGLNPYADFVMQTDAAIGEVMAALERHQIHKNTLLIVTSDNGCSPLARFDELKAGGHNPSGRFRGHKADIYEGGHRVPFLVQWPERIAPGSHSDRTIWLGDLLATTAEILGVSLPANAGEDSESFLPEFTGAKRPSAREAIVHHSVNGSFAIREGAWKLVFAPGSGGWSVPRPGKDDTSDQPLVQLFDLKADLGETRNVQAEHPEVVARLTKRMEQFISDGRSTPGAAQPNTSPVDLWSAAKQAHRPLRGR